MYTNTIAPLGILTLIFALAVLMVSIDRQTYTSSPTEAERAPTIEARGA